MLPQNRTTWVAGALLTLLFALFVCLIPKPENDLFFILRTGDDILRTHALPRTDTYSWTNYGTRWDVPEWGAFVLFAQAFRVGQFFGTWALMAALTVAAALVVFGWLARRAGPGVAFSLTSLGLLTLSPCVQERPPAFSFVLLPLALMVLLYGRNGRPRVLLALPPLCALWANLHQGVLAFAALVAVYAAGDALARWWQRRRQEWEDARAKTARAGRMSVLALACAGAACVSPYGFGVYRTVFVTLHDRALMAGVTEWGPIYTVAWPSLLPFAVLAGCAFGALWLSPRRSLPDTLAVAALFMEAVLHARNMALFAVGSLMIIGPHIGALTQERAFLRQLGARHRPLFVGFAVLYAAMLLAVSVASVTQDAGPRGLTAEGVGEAVARVPRYPEGACAFMERERFPEGLRLLNSFENGGFVLWRLPLERVFIDGRLDVYAGRTFDDNLVLARAEDTPARAALMRRYDPDCVLTTRASVARAFAADPKWQLVYADADGLHSQHGRIFLRRRPQFAALAARCLRDRP